MIYKEEQKDLFSVSSDYYLAHCISADFKMGAGIAKKFTEMGTRDWLFDLYNNKPYSWKGEGDCVYTWAANAKDKYKGVFHLITKGKYYPNLCSGVLTLLINGQEVKFGHDSKDWDWKTRMYNDDNYEDFWSSGGNCGFRNGYSESFVNQGEWRINAKELPEQFRKYAAEIEEVFNASVPHGCCGECL